MELSIIKIFVKNRINRQKNKTFAKNRIIRQKIEIFVRNRIIRQKIEIFIQLFMLLDVKLRKYEISIFYSSRILMPLVTNYFTVLRMTSGLALLTFYYDFLRSINPSKS